MNILKKDSTRTEMILIVGVIVLTIIVIARFFGTEIMGFFFGAGADIQVVGTDKEKELKKLTGVKGKDKTKETPRTTTGSAPIDQLDPNLYGDEEALAQQYYQQQEAQWAKLKATILWTFALVLFLVVLGLIGWKTYSIFMEIRARNIQAGPEGPEE